MKLHDRKSALILLVAVIFLLSARSSRAQNSISGMIFDANRQPVAKIDVELLDEFERLLRSTKTASSGLYIFQGLQAGNYYVQVRTGGTNYRETKERIQLGQTNRISGSGTSGSEAAQINFTLQFERRGVTEAISNEVIFAQSVPREAEKYFENALKKLKDEKHDEAVAELENALKIFPEYFLALEKIGYEYLSKSKFAEAEGAFSKALQVNAQSFSAKSGLGIAEYKLGKRAEAAKTLEESIALNQSSVNSYLFLGKIYRELKDFEKAETNLKKARELSKNKVADVHWELALLYYYNLNRPAAAADELELYLKAKPNAENKLQVEKLIRQIREKAKEKS
ncbi:MAG TPA: tetratricopeptide repeat protein [Pyrinomonadaceae bacterium]|jgi:Tfp pilus assembly protein PilF